MAVEELLTTKLPTTDTTERDGGMLLLSARLCPGLTWLGSSLVACAPRCLVVVVVAQRGSAQFPGHDLGHRPGATVSARAPAALHPIGYQSVVLGPPLNGPVTAEVIQPP